MAQGRTVSLTDQIRRASRSVCANVAEAYRKQRYVAHFRSKLTDADSEAAETQAWLDFALKCGYLTLGDYEEMNDVYEKICGGLVDMMGNAGEWCASHNDIVGKDSR